MALQIAKKDNVKVTITCKVPSDNRAGYEKRTFTARIKKLYGDAKKNFMDSLSDAPLDIDVCADMVTELDKLDWFVKDENGQPLELKGDTLAEFFELMSTDPVDYVLAPLAQECVKVQDEGYRRLLEAKN
jgi:hypothetical protein